MRFSKAKWHQMTKDAVIETLQTNAACGLSRKAACSRARKYGRNTLFDQTPHAHMEAARPYLTDPILWLLFASALIAVIFAQAALGICSLICLLAGLGFAVYTRRLQVDLDQRIAQYRIPSATVLRDGRQIRLSAGNVVPGDVLILREGDIVPCDCRLLEQKELFVRTLSVSDDGGAAWLSLAKDTDAIYPYGSDEPVPNHQNMLYGGSRILRGEARAVAVAIGEMTFLGAMETFTIPAETHSAERKEPFGSLRPYLRIYSIFLILLLLPLTLIGCLTALETHTVLGAFLAFCAITATGGYSILSFCFSAILQRARKDCFDGKRKGSGAVLKSERAMDTLAELTDVFVMGRVATSDGRPHILGAMSGDKLLTAETIGQEDAAWRPMCEAILLALSLRESELLATSARERFDMTALRAELTSISGLDREAMRLRFSEEKILQSQDGQVLLFAKTPTGKLLRQVSSDAESALRPCTLLESGGRLVALSQEKKNDFLRFVQSVRERGGHCIAVTGEYKSSRILFGVLAIGEEMQGTLPSVLEELRQSGVRVTFFLQDGEEELRYIHAVPFGRDREPVFSYSKGGSLQIRSAFEGTRILQGVPQKEIADLLKHLQEQGCRVGVLGSGIHDLPLLQRADLAISIDEQDWHLKDIQEGIDSLLNADGEPQSASSPSAIRRYADALIKRASNLGGGLFALSAAISHCRAARYRMRILLPILTASHLSRLALVLLGAIFGTGLLSASQILFSGLIVEFIFVHWILSLPVPQKRLRKCPMFDMERISKRAFLMSSGAPAICASCFIFIYAFILSCVGILDGAACASFFFISLILIQLTFFARELLRNGISLFSKTSLFHAGAILIPLILMIPASIFLPSLQAASGLGAWHITTVLALLAVIPITLLSVKILSFFRRTAK